MKRLLVIGLMVFALFTLAACGGNGDVAYTPSQESTLEQPPLQESPENHPPENQPPQESDSVGNAAIDSNAHGNSPGNLLTWGRFALYGNRIFFGNPDSETGFLTLYSMNIDGTDIRQVSFLSGEFINVIGGRIFFRAGTGVHNSPIMSIRTDGTDMQTHIEGEAIGHVIVAGDRIYWHTSQFGGNLNSVRIDGTDRQQITESSTRSTNIIGDRIFFSIGVDGAANGDVDAGNLFSMNIDGTNRLSIRDAASNNIIVDNAYVYFTAGHFDADLRLDYTEFYRMRHDGSGQEMVARVDMRVAFMNVHGDRVFFTDPLYVSRGETYGGKIHSIGIDGTDFRTLTDFPARNMAILGDRIYFNRDENGGSTGVYSMRLDGTDIRKYV